MNEQPNPVCVVIRPDGTAAWRTDVSRAERELGNHGIGRAFLTNGSKLRVSVSDSSLLLRDVYAPNPYAMAVLANVSGMLRSEAPETRGPVVLYAWDPRNEWDSTRPFTDDEYGTVADALRVAGCTVEPERDPRM